MDGDRHVGARSFVQHKAISMEASDVSQAAEATAVNHSGASALGTLVLATQQTREVASGSPVNEQLLTSLLLLVFMPASAHTSVRKQLSRSIIPRTPRVVGSKISLKVSFGTHFFAIVVNLSPFWRFGHL